MFRILGLIFTGIFALITTAIKGVAKLLSFLIHGLCLSLPFFYMLTGLIAHLLFKVLNKSGDFFYIYHFGLIVVFATSGIMLIRKIAVPKKDNSQKPDINYLGNIKNYDKPNVYRVKSNPSYVVYEFYDKYQLFYEGKNGLEYIRTDLKEQQYDAQPHS